MSQRELVSLLSDDETGLLNGAYFRLRADEEFKKACRFGWPVTLLVLDVDGLSAETRRRRAGLLDIAGVVLTNSRDVDLSARVADARFAMLLPGTALDGARVMVERVLGDLIERGEGRLVVHVGLTDAPRDGLQTSDEWYARAETAVGMARASGANQLVTWTAPAQPV